MSILANAVAECTQCSANFKFENYEIRSVMREDEAWFFAADVCKVLSLDNTAIRKLDDDEKGLHSTQTLGGVQEISIISESGLYTLILRCRDAVKQGTLPWRFRKWVTNEVLPAIRKTGRYEKKTASEPLSPKDMSNLTRLVWLMTNGMKFQQSWNAGVWHCLRAATGTPSPQQFSVDDLPALGEECSRILKITSAFNAAVYDFEKQVISKVLRRRGEIAPFIGQMNTRLAELQQLESDGLLALSKFDGDGVRGLINRT